jgi:hypothetical protein
VCRREHGGGRQAGVAYTVELSWHDVISPTLLSMGFLYMQRLAKLLSKVMAIKVKLMSLKK